MMRQTQLLFSKQTGAGLIEVLISVVILAVGLLGVASLQFIGSFNNAQSITRTQAELVARQVVEQLRAAAVSNTQSNGLVADDQYFDADNYNFTGLSCTGRHPYSCYCLTLPADVPNCRDGVCTASEIAQFDGWAASCSAVQVNPNMSIQVSCDDNLLADNAACSAGSAIEVKLSWPISKKSASADSVNTDCAVNGEAKACVLKDITL